MATAKKRKAPKTKITTRKTKTSKAKVSAKRAAPKTKAAFKDVFGARAKLGKHTVYRLQHLTKIGVAPNLEKLPFSIRILLEALLRNCDDYLVTQEDVKRLAAWDAANP